MNLVKSILTLLVMSAGMGCSNAQTEPDLQTKQNKNPYYSHTDTKPLNVNNAEWKKVLGKTEYYIAREAGTERSYSGAYWDHHASGTYYCGACGNLLFTSKTKFDSGTGWPSFYKPAAATSVIEKTDADGSRTEVECKRCGAHLGHVFDDGPKPTGLRYCMNGNILDFAADGAK